MRRFLSRLWSDPGALLVVALLLLAAALLGGCGSIRLPPIQPPEPPPVEDPAPPPVDCRAVLCAPGTHCEPGSGCVQDPVPGPPGPICVEGQTYGCYHNPGEGWLYACPVYDAAGGVIGVQNEPTPATCPSKPEPPPAPPTPPTPPAPPAACMSEPSLVATLCVGEQFGAAVLAATTKLGRLGSDCVANNAALAAELRASTGRCAIGGIEAVFIKRDDGLAEENHSCFFRDGSWTRSGRGKFMGCHSIGASAPPPSIPPAPPPPSVEGCSAPIPPKVAKWNIQFRNKWHDATPLFYNGAAWTWAGTPIVGYCNAVGFARLFCPARLDCEEGHDNFKCGERRACEGVGIGNYANAVPLFRCEHGAPEINPAQPFQARCAPGWLEVCATDGTNCTRSE